MLKQLREKRTMKWILWILAIIIIPAFVLWGSAGLRERGRYAGIIFGKKVPSEEYGEALNAVRNRGLIMYGSRFYEIEKGLDLEAQAWEYLIMLNEAKRKRIKVSDDEVVARIASFGFFQNKDGSFSRLAYETILNNAFRTSPRNFEEEMRRSIMIEKLLQGFANDTAEPTDAEIEEALKKEASPEGQKEETAEEKRERIKREFSMVKRFEAYQRWHDELYKRAGLVSNIKKAEEEEVEEEAPLE